MAPPPSSNTAPSPSGSSPPSPPASSPPSPPDQETPPSPPKSPPPSTQPPKSSPPSPPEGNKNSSPPPNSSPPAPTAPSPPSPSQQTPSQPTPTQPAPSKPSPSPPSGSPPSNPSSGSPPQQDNGGSGVSKSPPSGGGSSPPPPEKSSGTVNRPSQSSGSDGSGSRTKSHDSPSNDGGGNGGGTDGKIIAGVAAGVGIFIIVMIIFYVRRRRRKKDDFYGDSIKGNQKYYESSQYNNNTQQYQNWHQGHNQHTNQHTGGGGGGGGGGWGAPPALQPQMGMPTSGEDSSMYSDPPRPPLPPPSPNTALGLNQSTFSYDELSAATGGFAQANILGQGGFGYVHKGVLPSGKEIAVKSLKAGSGQGEREFQAEVDIISRVHHRYLVSLVGYCIAGQQRMLVYEFVPNDTLDHHLHGKDLPVMDFSTRVGIAMGSAKGLAYLHEDCHPRIIHRDIKSSNILLDFNFDAKVADFGLAKLSSDTYTHVSTRVMGTFGYLAPEYAASGKLTEKSDVFSFGVMLLELITGKRPVDNSFNAMEDSLVDWARPIMTKALEDGNFDELADPRLERCYNTREMVRMVTCAAASIRHSARKRPRMSQIVRALEGDVSLDDLNEGVKPGQSSIYGTSGGGSDYSQSSYQADMKKFRQLALTSEEFASSDYGVSSNESREMDPSKNPKSPKPIH